MPSSSVVIVAYSMLGAPITTEHGGPVRLYVAPMFGYKSLKWLSAIRVVERITGESWATIKAVGVVQPPVIAPETDSATLRPSLVRHHG